MLTFCFLISLGSCLVFQCKKRHVFLCPEYEESKRCSMGKYCNYRHAGELPARARARARTRVGRDVGLAKASATSPRAPAPEQPPTSSKDPADSLTRYYLKKDGNVETDEKDGGCHSGLGAEPVLLLPERSKLGQLPGFIPL